MHSNQALALLAFIGSAVNALPQGVTSAIKPSKPAPSGCLLDFPSTFGLAVVTPQAYGLSNLEVATQSPDGQFGPGKSSATPTPTPVAQISDGQVQHQTTKAPIAQISDGQIQHQTTVAPITQISDGQIQATYSPVTVLKTITSAQPASQIKDGQPQAPTGTALKTSVSTSVYSTLVTSGKSAPSSTSSAKPATPSGGNHLEAVSCRSKAVLTLGLKNSVLLDDQGRTGYIADNFQFQFDAPAQAGALLTAGWSVCPDNHGLLALGGSTTFYQCLSGDFYNLYDRDFGAGQCHPVNLQAVELQDC